MSDTTNEWGEDLQEVERRQQFTDRFNELMDLTDYPPFSINLEKHNEYREEVMAYSVKISEQIRESDAIEDRPFSTLMAKWEDDLDEAKLYKQRYGRDFVGAQKAAAKNDGISMRDVKPIGPPSAYKD